jgi:hypothetical protein
VPPNGASFGREGQNPRAPARGASQTFEPHVASEVFIDLLAEHDIPVVLGARLRSVDRRGGRIRGLAGIDSPLETGGTATYTVDQRSGGGQWVVLGRHTFAAGTAAGVRIRNDATDGYVIADAVRFTPAG